MHFFFNLKISGKGGGASKIFGLPQRAPKCYANDVLKTNIDFMIQSIFYFIRKGLYNTNFFASASEDPRFPKDVNSVTSILETNGEGGEIGQPAIWGLQRNMHLQSD